MFRSWLESLWGGWNDYGFVNDDGGGDGLINDNDINENKLWWFIGTWDEYSKSLKDSFPITIHPGNQ